MRQDRARAGTYLKQALITVISSYLKKIFIVSTIINLNFTEPRFPELVELLHVPLQSLYKKCDNLLTENGLSKAE